MRAKGWGSTVAMLLLLASHDVGVRAAATCSADIEALFRIAQLESHGLWVDDQADIIGGAVAREKFHNPVLNAFGRPQSGWYPVDGTKRVVCGTVEQWLLFRGPAPELDLHPYMIPSQSFLPAIFDLPPFGRTDGGENHVWGEVTPPAWLKRFWNRGDGAPVRGNNACGDGNSACSANQWVHQVACMYGPWVMERIYGYRVEIHPIQAMWGAEENGVHVYVLGDASGRFERAGSYRRRGASETFAPWDKPVAPTVWVATSAATAREAQLSVVIPGNPATPTVDHLQLTPDATVAVTHPADVVIRRGPACAADPDDIHALVSITARSSSQPLRELVISGDIRRRTPAVTPAHSEQRVPEAEADDRPEPLTLGLRAVEWGTPEGVVPGLNFNRTQAEWGLGPRDRVSWTFARTQRLQLQLEGTPPREPIEIRWTIEACDVETAPSNEECVPRSLGNDEDDTYVEITHGTKMRVTAPAGVRHTGLADPGGLRIFVRYPAPQPLGSGNVPHSTRLRLSAFIGGRIGAAPAFQYTLRNVAPDISAEIQSFDVEAAGGVLPDRLIAWIVGWMRQQGYPATRATLENDWRLGTRGAGQILGPFTVNLRRREARVLRLALLTFLEDNTLAAEEFTDLLEMLHRYGNALFADPNLAQSNPS